MLSGLSAGRIWLCTQPTDMRCSFDGLSARVRRYLGEDPTSGQWFVFINRRGTMLKILGFDTGGYWIWSKRLEQGQFALDRGAKELKRELNRTALLALVEGVDIKILRQRNARLPAHDAPCVVAQHDLRVDCDRPHHRATPSPPRGSLRPDSPAFLTKVRLEYKRLPGDVHRRAAARWMSIAPRPHAVRQTVARREGSRCDGRAARPELRSLGDRCAAGRSAAVRVESAP